MEAIVIKAKTKKDSKFWLELAKKIGAQAKSIDTEELEDACLAELIEKGMKTENVSRTRVMKALGR